MNTCRTCIFWGTPERSNHGYATCESPKNPHNDWKLVPDGAYGEQEDFYGHYFGISTGPDFGCIHHEAKHDDSE